MDRKDGDLTFDCHFAVGVHVRSFLVRAFVFVFVLKLDPVIVKSSRVSVQNMPLVAGMFYLLHSQCLSCSGLGCCCRANVPSYMVAHRRKPQQAGYLYA